MTLRQYMVLCLGACVVFIVALIGGLWFSPPLPDCTPEEMAEQAVPVPPGAVPLPVSCKLTSEDLATGAARSSMTRTVDDPHP
jgi:hypothetical protein